MADKPESPDSSELSSIVVGPNRNDMLDMIDGYEESGSESTESIEDPIGNGTLDMLDVMKKLGERRGPLRPMRPPFVVSSVSSADTSAAVSQDTPDDDNEEPSMSESILRRVLLRRLEPSPMKPLVLTANSPTDKLVEAQEMSTGETGTLLAGSSDGPSSVNDSALEQSH